MPRYKYLTRSFVEALGLERVPFQRARSGRMRSLEEQLSLSQGMLPMAEQNIVDGVMFEGHPYEREPDGLCFRLMGVSSKAF